MGVIEHMGAGKYNGFCPKCGAENFDEYNDIDFGELSICLMYTCGECGERYTEVYGFEGAYWFEEERA